MQLHTIQCLSGIDDPKVIWEKGDWVGTNMGNPVKKFDHAKFFTVRAEAERERVILEQFGCKFKLDSYALVKSRL